MKHEVTFDVSVEALHAIAACGHALWIASLAGSAPVTKCLYEWMKAPPRVGDLMLEISSFHRAGVVGHVGLLDRIEVRAVCDHEARDANHPGCDDCGPDDRCTEQYTWLITGVRGRDPVWQHRWSNAEFVRLPHTPADNEEISRLRTAVRLPEEGCW